MRYDNLRRFGLRFLPIFAGLATLILPKSMASAPAPQPPEKPITVKVLVLNFDPLIPQEGNRRLHEVCKWADPHKLAEGYMADVKGASRGFIRYNVVEWK